MKFRENPFSRSGLVTCVQTDSDSVGVPQGCYVPEMYKGVVISSVTVPSQLV